HAQTPDVAGSLMDRFVELFTKTQDLIIIIKESVRQCDESLKVVELLYGEPSAGITDQRSFKPASDESDVVGCFLRDIGDHGIAIRKLFNESFGFELPECLTNGGTT